MPLETSPESSPEDASEKDLGGDVALAVLAVVTMVGAMYSLIAYDWWPSGERLGVGADISLWELLLIVPLFLLCVFGVLYWIVSVFLRVVRVTGRDKGAL